MPRPTLNHENQLRAAGHAVVAGVDEAGRGPLAGPVCAAAVVLPADFDHKILNDSKQLTARQRDDLYAELTADPRVCWHCELVAESEIDRINILQATCQAMRLAVLGLRVAASAALIDGRPVRNFPVHQVALVKGDSLSLSIAAASVIAKVTRDRLMHELDGRFPEYGFAIHKGYGTKRHLAALRKHGPCPAHRRSFAPVAQLTLALDC